MSDAVKETMCTNCVHLHVCKNRIEYLKVVEACDRIKISSEDGSIFYVKDIDWIKSITPVCKNYLLYNLSKPGYRQEQKEEGLSMYDLFL